MTRPPEPRTSAGKTTSPEPSTSARKPASPERGVGRAEKRARRAGEAIALHRAPIELPRVAEPAAPPFDEDDLDDGLRAERDVERARYVDMLRRQQMEADVRAQRYEKQAARQRLELDRAMERWTTVRERAQGEPSDAAEVDAVTEDGEPRALDPIFDGAVRVRPRGEACD